MSQLAKFAKREQQEQKLEVRSATKLIGRFTIVATAVAALAALAVAALFAQSQGNDKYSLKSPGGIALSDFRGYEDLADISSSRTDDRLKLIVGNPTVINAFKSGIPA